MTHLNADGTWTQTQTPNYPDQGPWSGRYYVHGDEVTIVRPDCGCERPTAIYHGAGDGQVELLSGKLTLQNVIVADSASPLPASLGSVAYAGRPPAPTAGIRAAWSSAPSRTFSRQA